MRLGAARWTRRSRPSDPARWRSRSAHAEQRAAGDDPPDHRGAPGSLIYTDEYDIYARLTAWGYGHKTVCHARGEYARDDDGDGLCEVHVNTMEGGCCAPGSALIAASPKRSSPCISASSSSFTTPAAAAKPCSAPWSPRWSRDHATTLDPDKSQKRLKPPGIPETF